MNTIALFLSAVAATVAYIAGHPAIGSTFVAIGILVSALNDYGASRPGIR